MSNSDIIFRNVSKHLKTQFNENSEFKKEMENLLHFYGRKFMNLAKNVEQKQYIEENLYDLIKSQYFQGYYIMKNMLLDQETHLQESIWTLSKGIVRNEIPILMNEVFNNNDDWYQTELSQSIGMQLIHLIPGVYDLVRQTRKDIALYAAFKAFIEDDRYITEKVDSNDALIGDPFDLTFLNPQVYLQVQYLTDEQEVYDLYSWSTIKTEGWVGSCHFSEIPLENSKMYLLELTISEQISNQERYALTEEIVNKLPLSIKETLQVRLYHVHAMEVLVPSS